MLDVALADERERRRRHRHGAQGHRQRHARPAGRSAQGPVQSAGRQPARRRRSGARLPIARQGKWAEARDALQGYRCRARHVAARTAAHGVAGRACAPRSRCTISPAPATALNEFQTDRRAARKRRPRSPCWCGRLAGGLGRNEDALTNYRAAAASSDRRAAAPDGCARSCCAIALGDMPRKEVIDQLETLTTVWRGDETEVEGAAAAGASLHRGRPLSRRLPRDARGAAGASRLAI